MPAAARRRDAKSGRERPHAASILRYPPDRSRCAVERLVRGGSWAGSVALQCLRRPVGQPPRDNHVDRDQQVAASPLPPADTPRPLHPERAARGRARRDPQRHRATTRVGTMSLGAEGCLRERDRHGDGEVVARGGRRARAAPRAPGRGRSPGGPPARRTTLARRAASADRRRPRPARALEGGVAGGPGAAVAGRARGVDDRAGPRQSLHGSAKAKPPAGDRLSGQCPLQTGQVCGEVPGFAPVPGRCGQAAGDGQPQGHGGPPDRLGEASVTSVSTSAPRGGGCAAAGRRR